MTDQQQDAVEHCPNCGQAYRGYHRCEQGNDRVEFTCSDCDEHVERERNKTDIEGIAPVRCVTCTLEAIQYV